MVPCYSTCVCQLRDQFSFIRIRAGAFHVYIHDSRSSTRWQALVVDLRQGGSLFAVDLTANTPVVAMACQAASHLCADMSQWSSIWALSLAFDYHLITICLQLCYHLVTTCVPLAYNVLAMCNNLFTIPLPCPYHVLAI